MTRWPRRLAGDLGELVFPSYCALCGCDADGACVCPRCAADLRESATEPFCRACGSPLAADGLPCPFCEGRGYGSIASVTRLAGYDAQLRRAVHLAKFKSRPEVATWLGEMLGEACGHLAGQIDAVLAVPMHPRRELARGYDQARLIAKPVARAIGVRLIDAAVRDRYTVPQVEVRTGLARRANVRDAFVVVRPARVTGRRILLVDDILTTGATLRSLARAVKTAKPAEIHVATVAVADPRRQEWGEEE